MPIYFYTNSSTTMSTLTIDPTWSTWINTSTTLSNNEVWYQWNDATTTACGPGSYFITTEPAEPTPEEIAAAKASQVAEMARRKQRESELRIAEDRAEQLLIGFLDEEQRAQLKQQRHFIVTGRSGRRYRIRRGRVANVDVIDRAGTITHRLCAHPRDVVPDFDGMLIQKLMLEDDEENFTKVANRHPSMNRDAIVLPALQ